MQPDAIFALALRNAAKLFMLEVDNGNMPVVRHDLHQTSLMRKLLAYAETDRSGVPASRFGMDSMRALFVVPSRERADTLLHALQRLVASMVSLASPQLFLVIDRASLHGADGGFLLAKWRDANGVERLLFE